MSQTLTFTNSKKPRQLPPVVPAPGLMGWMSAFRRNPLEPLVQARDAGDLVRLRLGAQYLYIASHPDYIKHILQDNNRGYSKDTRVMSILRLFSGENIFTAEGEFWFHRRRLMQPAFHRQHIASFGTVMAGSAQGMLARWEAMPAGQRFDLSDEMRRVTLTIVGRTLFSVDLSNDTDQLGKAFTFTSEDILFRVQHPFYFPLRFPTPRNRRAKRTRETVTAVIQRIIRERAESGDTKNDLLSLLMNMKDEETGEGLTEEELGREITTMVFAGHETTATTLTWAWYLLSQSPEAEAKLHAELQHVLNGRAPATDDVPNLIYTRRVIDETLRLYPAAWSFGRETLRADELGGYTIPAKQAVLMSPFAIHRDPRFWSKPDVFEPDRFAPEQEEKRPRFSYMPFGGGPRICIGQPFALAEATLLLASIAQRYTLQLVPGTEVKPEPHITLGVANGLPMMIIPR